LRRLNFTLIHKNYKLITKLLLDNSKRPEKQIKREHKKRNIMEKKDFIFSSIKKSKNI
jgi:hypothetical protein